MKRCEHCDNTCRMLLPLLDLINHANQPAANVRILQAENGDLYAYTLRDIRAGEEVRGQAISGHHKAVRLRRQTGAPTHRQLLPKVAYSM